jgi:hypothetical protein
MVAMAFPFANYFSHKAALRHQLKSGIKKNPRAGLPRPHFACLVALKNARPGGENNEAWIRTATHDGTQGADPALGT